jgi:hypothetical protein
VIGESLGELPLFGEARPAAAILHGSLEQLQRTALLVELEQIFGSRNRQRDVQQRLGDAVGLDRAPGEVDDWDVKTGSPAPTEVVS